MFASLLCVPLPNQQLSSLNSSSTHRLGGKVKKAYMVGLKQSPISQPALQ